jgi:hypothetical protein
MQTEQQNDLREIALEDQRRQEEMDRKMREMDIYGGNAQTPVTLRDMYGRVRDVAKEMGSYEDVLKMQEKIENLDRQKQMDDLNETYRKALIDAKGRVGTRGGGSGGSKRLFQLENPETGEKGIFREDEANQKLDEGWDFYKRDDLGEILRPSNKKPESKQSEPSAASRFLSGLFGDEKPGEKAAEEQKQVVEGIKDQAAATVKPMRAPKPGMKWQRNKKTGELREVPA